MTDGNRNSSYQKGLGTYGVREGCLAVKWCLTLHSTCRSWMTYELLNSFSASVRDIFWRSVFGFKTSVATFKRKMTIQSQVRKYNLVNIGGIFFASYTEQPRKWFYWRLQVQLSKYQRHYIYWLPIHRLPNSLWCLSLQHKSFNQIQTEKTGKEGCVLCVLYVFIYISVYCCSLYRLLWCLYRLS